MQFLLGVVAGIGLSTITVATLAYFRSEIERRVTIVEKVLYNAGPRPRGFIVDAQDDAEMARERIIEENERRGKDTKLSDLS